MTRMVNTAELAHFKPRTVRFDHDRHGHKEILKAQIISPACDLIITLRFMATQKHFERRS
jgi:hypothetical protein